MNEKLEKALETQLGEKYYNQSALQYDTNVGTLLTPYEYKMFLLYKENVISKGDKRFINLPLVSFNHRFVYYSLSLEFTSLIDSYYDLIKEDRMLNDVPLNERYSSSFDTSRIYSEIEGSLNVENVPTTRRRLKELLEDNVPPKSKNDIIIKNMALAIEFVQSKPTFNKENLFKLYSTLSKDCLNDDDKLKEGDIYRYDTVTVGSYQGCPHTRIEECMNSLFSYVNAILEKGESLESLLLPHVAHYYLLYIHPYFDLNGRTARMVSYWLYLLSGDTYFPPIISEAINQNKSKYYRALEQTRDNHNDLSYFLLYIFNTTIKYILCYHSLDSINKECKSRGVLLTSLDLHYIKRIILSYEGAFTYLDFMKFANIEISKQGALKILNKLVHFGVLKQKPSPSKIKMFEINTKHIPFKSLL